MADAALIAPRLIVFSDTTRAEPALFLTRYAALARRALPGSVLFTLRDYGLSLAARLALGEQLAVLASQTEQRFGVADRADLARALGCTGFHVPGAGLSARDARQYLGPRVFLSKGSHEPAREPEPELDALLVSPIFEARKGRPALGLGVFERVRGGPARYALGGVDAQHAADCLAAGAAGVAVIGAALALDPEPLLSGLGILRDTLP
jgi:thiamine-phosphate pyrophosphorylase